MRILLIGSGGREAALAWKIAQSPLVNDVIVSPGNAGMRSLSSKIQLKKVFSREEYLSLKPDLVVIGPEAPLSEGLTDYFESKDILVTAPTKAAALLEGSKAFCKAIFEQAHIPTADHVVVENIEEARLALNQWDKEGVVVKVDALAQGKGVIVCNTKEEALMALKSFFDGSYLGYPVEKILLEEKITGPEVSAFALCDGDSFIYLGSATDYKRLNDNDEGPNTGGMGTISPSPVLSPLDEEWIKNCIFAPTLKVMKENGTPFKGFLFAGLMKTDNGFYALEFNTRMGDPETQSLIPRIKEDIVPLLKAAAEHKLHDHSIKPNPTYAIHLVMSAEGYPGTNGQRIKSGDEIITLGLNPDTLFFTAGVSYSEGKLTTSGGRICGLTVTGKSLSEIRSKIYEEAKKVQFSGMHYRRDIGARFL